jgi:peptidoglycan-associated lipoprotein
MTNYPKITFGFLVLSAAVALTGCSSTAKPDVASAAPASTRAESKKELTPAPSDSTTKSSLEALQRGESTATPATSPLKDIYFDFDRYDLSTDARETLKANGNWLKANPSAVVQMEGHCDERGTTEYNVALGAKRAQVAKDYLVTLGVPAERLSTISYGKELPVCADHNEECWHKNRRDRFIIQPTRPAA